MNATELARKLNTSMQKVRWLIYTGQIDAKKVNRVWSVDEGSVRAFRRRNAKAIERLKTEYVSLYWAGISVKRLQERARDDFKTAGIVCHLDGFAEQTIYESIMEGRNGSHRHTG